MKKLYSLLLAVASTTFLAVGAMRAAEHCDAIGRQSTFSSTVPENSAMNCNMPTNFIDTSSR